MEESTEDREQEPTSETAPVSRWRRWAKRAGFVAGAPVAGVLVVAMWLDRRDEPHRFDREAAARVQQGEVAWLVPGAELPAGLKLELSHNNCDAVRHEEWTYLAFRTAPHHFASPKARLIVLRSRDRVRWSLEADLALGADLREPRFLVFEGELFLYFFLGGTDALAFEPQQVLGITREAAGWSEPREVLPAGFVPWRAKVHGGRAYMSAYLGTGLYTTEARPGEVRLFVSDDGWAWAPISEDPQLTAVGATETAFSFTADGDLVAVARLETQGSMVCTASRDDLSTWETTYSPYKLDSPLTFRRGDTIYLIARRSLGGEFWRGAEVLPDAVQRGWSLVRYSLTRKRTCLYRVDLETRQVVPVVDLPGHGDTCFPALVPLDDARYWFVNYSSPLLGRDSSWLAGQLRRTQLYSMELRFE